MFNECMYIYLYVCAVTGPCTYVSRTYFHCETDSYLLDTSDLCVYNLPE